LKDIGGLTPDTITPPWARPGLEKDKYHRQSQQSYRDGGWFGCRGRGGAYQKIRSEVTVGKYVRLRSGPGQGIGPREKSGGAKRQLGNRREGLNLKPEWIGRCCIGITANGK
jgi:hypothetical protein